MLEWQINHIADLDNFTRIMRVLPVSESTYHVYGSFGDVYVQLSALKELLEEKDEAFHILIDEKFSVLASQALGSKVGKLYSNGNIINNLFNKIGLIGKMGGLPIRLLPTLYPGCSELILKKRLNYSDFLRGIIGSKKKGFFSKIEDTDKLKIQAEKIILNAGCTPNKTVILSLDNNTQKELSTDFWMNIVELIKKAGLQVLLNDSGTLNSIGANLLSNTNLPRIKVEPNLAVTIPSVAGGYLGGTNGFSTIQALFNDIVPGVHFLNSIDSQNNNVVDKFGNEFDENVLYHSETFRDEFRNHQIEVLVNKNTSHKVILNLMAEYIELVMNKVET